MDNSKSDKVAIKASATRGVATAAAPSLDRAEVSKRIDKKIAELGYWRGETLAQLRRLIHEVDPEVAEDWKYMGTPFWSHEGMFALADTFKDKVKLTFHPRSPAPWPEEALQRGLEWEKVAGD